MPIGDAALKKLVFGIAAKHEFRVRVLFVFGIAAKHEFRVRVLFESIRQNTSVYSNTFALGVFCSNNNRPTSSFQSINLVIG